MRLYARTAGVDTRATRNYGFVSHQNSAPKKRNRIKALILVRFSPAVIETLAVAL
jgi:hypothetical protein